MKVFRKLCSVILCCCLLGVFLPQQVHADTSDNEIEYQGDIEAVSSAMTLQTGGQGTVGVIGGISFTPALPAETQELHPDQYTTEYVTYSYEMRWDSSDESVVSIEETNSQYVVFVHGLNPGEATVTAHLIIKKGVSSRYFGPDGINFTSYTTETETDSESCDITVTQPVYGITLNAEQADVIVGDSLNLVATIDPENASNKNISWTSDNPEVADVDEKGNVTALSVGEAVITATTEDGNYTAQCVIDAYKEVDSVKLSETSITAKENDSVSLSAEVSPSDARYSTLKWTSDNTDVATVTDEGTVTALHAGTANINVTVDDSDKTASCIVTVTHDLVEVPAKDATYTENGNVKYWKCNVCGKCFKDSAGTQEISADSVTVPKKIHVDSIKINKNELSLKVGETETLSSTISPENATNKSFKWSSSDTSVATVDQNGKVTALSVGEAVITATTEDGNHIDQCIVDTYKEVESVKLSKKSITAKENDSVSLSAVVSPADARYNSLKWTSSDTNVASVSQEGLITALHAGKAVINVAVDDSDKIDSCIVTVMHDLVEVPAKEATYSEDGNIKYWKCNGCGKCFKDSAATEEIDSDSVILPKKIHVDSIDIDKTELGLKVGETETLSSKITPENATNKSVKWSSSDSSVATVDQDGKVTAIKVGTADISVTAEDGNKKANCKVTVNPKSVPGVKYKTYVQTYGDQKYVSNGQMSGTTGQSKRLEGIWIQLTDHEDLTGSVIYRTHVQSIGWQDWVQDNEMSGTTGKAKRLEAIQIKLDGEMAQKYDIYYCVHAQHFGWLDWAKNGESAGTEGFAYRLEGIRICLVEKGGKAPDPVDSGNAGITYYKNTSGVTYRTHVQTYGTLNWVQNGKISGTQGKSKRMEAIRIKLTNPAFDGNIEYQTHVQTYGWEKTWKKDGELSGTQGEAKRLEAIRIRLTGDMAKNYDVYYRVHAQHFGWLGWAKNGENSGTAGYGYRLEAVEVKLVPKGQAAPGQTTNTYYQK